MTPEKLVEALEKAKALVGCLVGLIWSLCCSQLMSAAEAPDEPDTTPSKARN
jgi:hypothetical protein